MAQNEGADRMFPDAHNIVVEYAVTLGIPGLALFLAFVFFALRVLPWRSPLAGFGVLALAMHLVEPIHVTATPLAFLALGMAAAGPRPRPPVVPNAVPVTVGVVAAAACVPWVIGTNHMDHGANTATQVLANTKTARDLLGFWPQPYAVSANGDLLIARSAPTNQQLNYVNLARQWRQQAAFKGPDDPDAWNQLGVIDLALNQLPAAESDFRHAVRDNPWSTSGLKELAAVLRKEGHPDEAAKYEARLKLVNPSGAATSSPASSSSSSPAASTSSPAASSSSTSSPAVSSGSASSSPASN
jgi:hypothetical protein